MDGENINLVANFVNKLSINTCVANKKELSRLFLLRKIFQCVQLVLLHFFYQLVVASAAFTDAAFWSIRVWDQKVYVCDGWRSGLWWEEEDSMQAILCNHTQPLQEALGAQRSSRSNNYKLLSWRTKRNWRGAIRLNNTSCWPCAFANITSIINMSAIFFGYGVLQLLCFLKVYLILWTMLFCNKWEGRHHLHILNKLQNKIKKFLQNCIFFNMYDYLSGIKL